MARLTGLEPATSGVTGRHSNQLSYNRAHAPINVSSPPHRVAGTGRCPIHRGGLEGRCGEVKRFAVTAAR